MTQWTTRVFAVVAAVAGCGDDGGGATTTTTLPMVTTVPVSAGEADGSSSSGGGGSETSDGTGGATSSPTTTAATSTTTSPVDPTTGPVDPTVVDTTTTGGLEDTGVSTGDSTGSDMMKLDVGVLLDVPPPPPCLKCALTIASQQSGTLAANGPDIFATAQLNGQVVYALGTHGQGRFIATADSSLPFNEQTDCPLTDWLAANGGVAPKVMYFGWGPQDGPKNWNQPSDANGIHLPAQFVGNAALLLETYDIVMYLEGSAQFGNDAPSDAEMNTMLEYLQLGGGMYISSEFYGYLKDQDITSVNRLLTPLGAPTQPVSLNWGNVDGNIDFECFPEPQ